MARPCSRNAYGRSTEFPAAARDRPLPAPHPTCPHSPHTLFTPRQALAEKEGDGMAKMMYRKDTGEILGVHIIGLHAADLIHEASNAIATKQTVQVGGGGGSCCWPGSGMMG